jgi:hypothetical protein
MKHIFFIFFIIFSLLLKSVAQKITSTKYDTIVASREIEINEIRCPQFFKYTGYLITDSVNNENRYAKKVTNNNAEFYMMHCLSETEVYKVEKFLAQWKNSKKIIPNKVNNNLPKSKELFYLYRQYNSYFLNKDSVVVNIIFCTKYFFDKNKYFRYVFLPVVIVNNIKKPPLYMCKIIASNNFNKLIIVSFNKYF